jgi:hypothetical protein
MVPIVIGERSGQLLAILKSICGEFYHLQDCQIGTGQLCRLSRKRIGLNARRKEPDWGQVDS